MSKAKTIAIVAVLMIAGMALAQTPPGLITLALNDSMQTPLTRVNYAADGVGWGVKFNPFSADANARYVELTGADVRLCPPPMDGYYQEKFILVKIVNGKPDFTQVLWTSAPFDVRVGYWWHHMDITPSVWVKQPTQVALFAICVQGHAYMYQFFDGADNAAAGTQWYYNGTSAKRDRTAGDIMINLTYKKHDWSCNGITNPPARKFTPVARISNVGGFGEAVDATFWVTKGKTTVGGPVWIHNWAPGAYGEYVASFPQIDLTGVSGHEFRAHCQVQYHAPGFTYPYGERYPNNDQWNLPFQLYPFGTKVTGNSANE